MPSDRVLRNGVDSGYNLSTRFAMTRPEQNPPIHEPSGEPLSLPALVADEKHSVTVQRTVEHITKAMTL